MIQTYHNYIDPYRVMGFGNTVDYNVHIELVINQYNLTVDDGIAELLISDDAAVLHVDDCIPELSIDNYIHELPVDDGVAELYIR